MVFYCLARSYFPPRCRLLRASKQAALLPRCCFFFFHLETKNTRFFNFFPWSRSLMRRFFDLPAGSPFLEGERAQNDRAPRDAARSSNIHFVVPFYSTASV